MKGYLRLYTFIFWISPNLAKYSHGLSPLKQALQNWKNGKNSAYQGFKKFVFFSLTCSQIWLKPSCGRLPVHLPHKIAQQNENKKKKPDNTGFFVTYGGLVLWWWHAFLVSILGLGFRVQNDGKSQTVRLVTIARAFLNSSPSCVLLACVHREGNVVSCALFLDHRLCFYFFYFLKVWFVSVFFVEDLLFYGVASNCNLGSLYLV